MALIICPECGKEFSDKATVCPNCAYPVTFADKVRCGDVSIEEASSMAENYYDNIQYTKAFAIFYALAEKENERGCYFAGKMMMNGKGTSRNIEKGIELLQKAVEMNNPRAALFLARYYFRNDDREKSLNYYNCCYKNERASNFSDTVKGEILYHCSFLQQTDEEKLAFLERAFSYGYADSVGKIGTTSLAIGEKLIKENEYKKAVKYLQKALNNGCESAKEELINLYIKFSQEENDDDKKESFLLMAAELGSEVAKSILGEFYYYAGLGEPFDEEKIVKSASFGCVEAKEKLGAYYNHLGAEYFDDISVNDNRAEKYFLKAIEYGNQSARGNLGSLYNHMAVKLYNETPPDLDSAEKYFEKAVSMGNKNADKSLGILYNQFGITFSKNSELKDINKAEEYFIKAYQHNFADAKNNLVVLYIDMYFAKRYGLDGNLADKVKADMYLDKANAISTDIVAKIADKYFKKAEELLNKGIDKENYKKIIGELKRAHKLGDKRANEVLGKVDFDVFVCYKKGINGFDKNKERAGVYLRRAAHRDNPQAEKNINISINI